MFLPLVLLFSTVASLKLTHVPGKPRLSQAPRPIKSQFGISSLLKLTEKNVNNETRDSLLDIIQKAEMENDDALLACGQVTTKLAEAKVSIANAIVANGEEKTKLDEALEANGKAQTANAEVKTKLEERDVAYAAFRAYLANSPLADEKGEHAAIQDRVEAANDAAKADNVKEAEELTAAAAAIKESQTKNEEELENLQNDETANTAAIAGNAAEKQKLDETAASIAKIKEVVNANSDPIKEIKEVDCDSSEEYFKHNVPFGYDLSRPFVFSLTFNTAVDWIPTNGAAHSAPNPARDSGGIFGYRNLEAKDPEVKSLLNLAWGEGLRQPASSPPIKYFRAYMTNDEFTGANDIFKAQCMVKNVIRGQDYTLSIGWDGETIECIVDGTILSSVKSSAGFGTWPKVAPGMGRYMNQFCWATGGGDRGWKGTIKNFVVMEDVWPSEPGACRGGPNWPGLDTVFKCLGAKTHHDCQKICAENDDCGAYDHNHSLNHSCCLFAKGNKGTGQTGEVLNRCYVKPEQTS